MNYHVVVHQSKTQFGTVLCTVHILRITY